MTVGRPKADHGERDALVLAWLRDHPGSSAHAVGIGVGLSWQIPGRGRYVAGRAVHESLTRLEEAGSARSAPGRRDDGVPRLEWTAT